MGLTRRHFLASPAAAILQPRQPNVLVFMSDQESALLPGPVSLPNRARLTKTGVSFTLAFANTPQCSATRSSLLTGLEPHRAGVIANVDPGSLGKPLAPSLPNVGSVFRRAGYSTGYFGKWHLGGEDSGLDRFGFSTYRKGTDDEVARAAADWIRNQKSPWLAWVSVLNPHDIYEFPGLLQKVTPRPGVRPPRTDRSNLVENKPSEQLEYVEKDHHGQPGRDFSADDWVRYRSHYCELVEKVDAQLGVTLDAVSDLDSTIAVYTSDHGDALGEHGLTFKGPFMYDEGIHVPFVVRAPGGRMGKEPVRRDLITLADLAPTLASLAGIEWPAPVSGADLTSPAERDAVFLEYYAKQKWVNPIRTIRTRRWKLNAYDRGNRELYDLASDPHEVRNLADDPASRGVRERLQTRLDAWRKPILAHPKSPKK